MTVEQFNQTAFYPGDKAKFKGEYYLIGAVDFEERKIGLVDKSIIGDYNWQHISNCGYSPAPLAPSKNENQ